MKFALRSLIVLSILFCLSLKPGKSANLTVYTQVHDYEFCNGSTNAVAISVTNLIAVDSLNLVLSFDPAILEYKSFHGVHSQLIGGTLAVSELMGAITINWHGPIANLLNDTLLRLVFEAHSQGNSGLTWDTVSPSCFYFSEGGVAIPGLFYSGSAKVSSAIRLTITEIDPTCYGRCNANYLATVTGGTKPYTYLWNGNPGRFDSIQTSMCDGPNLLFIKDSKGCEADSLFTINGMPGPKVRLIIEPDTINKLVYLQNPVMKFSLEETGESHITEPPLWEFGDGDTAKSFNPRHEYKDANVQGEQGFYTLKVHLVNINGCDTTITQKLSIQEAEIKIGNVMTPDGYEENNVFKIVNTKYNPGDENLYPMDAEFQHIELYVFDRWGRRVFADSNYKNDWTARGLPDGAYFYVAKLYGKYKTFVRRGSLTILNSGVK